ncbi:hypothetical protein GCM10011374_38630 [Kocuria dechangensis]|uniref:Uncharacterized protein n=1 Tax=Kocuria dechangensis TaxID=1176249 RepID=A0A917H873_9MICC|nr:hypothetical protein [Kocuria dechangensis]GGG70367.1 hypothetical protein GCM10011374_38630 [Kocuria dechangensis]
MTWHNKETYFDRVNEDSQGITVECAVIREPGGNEHPGIAFRNGGFPKFVVHADAAHRLAVELVDALEELKAQSTPLRRQTAVSAAFEALADR